MAGRQGSTRRQGAGGLKPLSFTTLTELRAVAAAASGRPVTVLTPVNAGRYAGSAYYFEMLRLVETEFPAARLRAVLDCGDDAAIALAALDLGWRAVILRGNATARARVGDIANRLKSEVLARRPAAVELSQQDDPAAYCRAYFERD